MRAYYNEFDPFAANWLRALIEAGLITPGDVDERSIADVQPSDLDGYERCHFFAGIGGWDLALQYAGWGDATVWTGSAPCQPFSSAGKRRGTDDERHLWPEFARLIRECKPPTVFGEQVASKAGRGWLDGVFADLEGMGYAAAGADLCAAGINAPHIRQRLFWVADAGCDKLSGDTRAICATQAERDSGRELNGRQHIDAGDGREVRSGQGNSINTRPQGHSEHGGNGHKPGRQHEGSPRSVTPPGWHDFDLVRCVEPTKEPGRCVEKWRRVEPGLVPLAHGIPGRVGRLRGYGNAIVPQVAAEFITAYIEATGDNP